MVRLLQRSLVAGAILLAAPAAWAAQIDEDARQAREGSPAIPTRLLEPIKDQARIDEASVDIINYSLNTAYKPIVASQRIGRNGQPVVVLAEVPDADRIQEALKTLTGLREKQGYNQPQLRNAEYYLHGLYAQVSGDQRHLRQTQLADIYDWAKKETQERGVGWIMETDSGNPNTPAGGAIWARKGLEDGKLLKNRETTGSPQGHDLYLQSLRPPTTVCIELCGAVQSAGPRNNSTISGLDDLKGKAHQESGVSASDGSYGVAPRNPRVASLPPNAPSPGVQPPGPRSSGVQAPATSPTPPSASPAPAPSPTQTSPAQTSPAQTSPATPAAKATQPSGISQGISQGSGAQAPQSTVSSAPPTNGQPANGQPASAQPATGQPATGQSPTGQPSSTATTPQPNTAAATNPSGTTAPATATQAGGGQTGGGQTGGGQAAPSGGERGTASAETGAAGNQTTGNQTTGNQTAGNQTTENQAAAKETTADRTATGKASETSTDTATAKTGTGAAPAGSETQSPQTETTAETTTETATRTAPETSTATSTETAAATEKAAATVDADSAKVADLPVRPPDPVVDKTLQEAMALNATDEVLASFQPKLPGDGYALAPQPFGAAASSVNNTPSALSQGGALSSGAPSSGGSGGLGSLGSGINLSEALDTAIGVASIATGVAAAILGATPPSPGVSGSGPSRSSGLPASSASNRGNNSSISGLQHLESGVSSPDRPSRR